MNKTVSALVLIGVLTFGVNLVYGHGVNGARIAAIGLSANQVDINAGKRAAARSSNDGRSNFGFQ